jgi:6-phosphogluconolactonase
LAIFSVDGGDGSLTALGQQPTEPTPRAFTLDPSGDYLFAAGQGSGKLAAYRVDSSSGALDPLATYDVGKTPSWVEIVDTR